MPARRRHSTAGRFGPPSRSAPFLYVPFGLEAWRVNFNELRSTRGSLRKKGDDPSSTPCPRRAFTVTSTRSLCATSSRSRPVLLRGCQAAGARRVDPRVGCLLPQGTIAKGVEGERLARMPRLSRLRLQGFHPARACGRPCGRRAAPRANAWIDCHKGIAHRLPALPFRPTRRRGRRPRASADEWLDGRALSRLL